MITIYRMLLQNKEKDLERQPVLVCNSPKEALKALDIYATDGFHFVRLETVAQLNYVSKGAMAALRNSWLPFGNGKAEPAEKKEPEAEA